MPTLQLGIDSRGAKRGADEFVKQTDRITNSSKSAETAILGMFAALGGGYAIKSAFDQVAGFEQRLAEIQGVTGATAEEFNRLEGASRRLGVSSQYSATQAAESMLNLSKAGFTVTESIQSVDEVLSLAQAHGLDLGRSSEILIAAMRQFGITTDEATRVIDSFSATANLSSADVEDLAKSMEFAGPFANALGLNLEEVNATLGVLSNVMIRGAKGGTALRAILEGLANPTTIAKKAMKDMGVTVDDLNPQLHSMTEIFTMLGQRNMTAVQAVKIFGVEAASAALALTRSAPQIDVYIQKQKEMIGSTAELAKIMAATPSGALGKFLAAIREITISMGRDSGLTNAFVTAATFLRDVLITAFTDFDDTVTSNKATVDQFIRVMQGLAAATITRLVVPAFVLLGTQIQTAALAMKAFTIAMMTNPIGLLLTALAAGVGAIVYFKDSMIEMGDKSFTVLDLLTATWQTFAEAVKQVFKDIGDAANLVLDWFGESWLQSIKNVVNVSIASFMTMKDAFMSVFDTITNGVKAIAGIDWSSNISIALGAASLVSAFNPEKIGIELAAKTGSNFSRDWVKEMTSAAQTGWSAFQLVWNNFSFADMLDSVDIVKSITDRANALRKEREAALAVVGPERDVATAVKEVAQEVTAATEATKGLTKEQEDAIATLNEMLLDLEFERRLVGQTTAEQERLNKTRDAERLIREAQLENGEKYLTQLQKELDLLQQARGNQWYEQYLKNVRSDMELVNMSNDARQIAIALREAEAYGLDNNVRAMSTYLTKLQKELELLQKMQQIKQLADNIGDAFSYALGDIVVGAKNANEALNDLLITIYKLVFNQIVGQPIAQAISTGLYSIFGGMFTAGIGAKGLAYDAGGITPMAAGGIVRSPTRVPMANGSALMGEQGAEAVFPLTRMADGRLGLSADTGSSSGSTVVNVTVYAKDADSFRRAKHQIAAEMQRAASRAAGTA